MSDPHEPRKNVGEIGSTHVVETAIGVTATVIAAHLPTNKEQLEAFFASRFVVSFDQQKPLGPNVTIANLVQNTTSDLDFSIACPAADYLELAELNPRSEEFGRVAYRTGRLDVYSYAKWMYFRIIASKQRKYGHIAHRCMLLLYVTHWQFLPSESVVACLRSFCATRGCGFAAVFVLLTNGSDLVIPVITHPWVDSLPHPKGFKGRTYHNLDPGGWRVNATD